MYRADRTNRALGQKDGWRTRRQRLFQFVCLLSICHAERVQILATPNLEFGHRLRLLDLDGLGILPPGSQKEILDLADLLGLWHMEAVRLSLFSTNANTDTVDKNSESEDWRADGVWAGCERVLDVKAHHLVKCWKRAAD